MNDIPESLINVALTGGREVTVRARMYTDTDGTVHVFAERTRRDLMNSNEEFEVLDLGEHAKMTRGGRLSIALDIDVD